MLTSRNVILVSSSHAYTDTHINGITALYGQKKQRMRGAENRKSYSIYIQLNAQTLSFTGLLHLFEHWGLLYSHKCQQNGHIYDSLIKTAKREREEESVSEWDMWGNFVRRGKPNRQTNEWMNMECKRTMECFWPQKAKGEQESPRSEQQQ